MRGAVAIPVCDAWDIGDVDDIAHAAENAVGERASRSCRGSILVHGLEGLCRLLLCDVVALPLFSFQVLLRPLLLDVEAP